MSLLAGIALFFVLEKLVLWRHCHDDHCETHDLPHAHGATHAQQLGRAGHHAATPCTTCSTAC